MKDFEYLQPETCKEALDMLASYQGDGKLLLGGTDLMVRLQKGAIETGAVIDLKRAADISDTLNADSGKTVVGSRTTLAELARDDGFRTSFPALVDAVATVGSIQIRNRATLTGNICNASPAADTVPPLIIYGASVTVTNTSGDRIIPLADFITGPGETLCSPSELVTSVSLPAPKEPFGAAFGRLTRRRGVDLATINMACGIEPGGIVTFVYGAAGPKPVIARDESGIVLEESLSEADLDRLLHKLVATTNPITDVRAGKPYRQAMLMTLSKRVLKQAREEYMIQAAKGYGR